MSEEAGLLEWFPMPRAFIADMQRVNVDDLLLAWREPGMGVVIRVDGMDGPPIIPISESAMKLYPIEDEL